MNLNQWIEVLAIGEGLCLVGFLAVILYIRRGENSW